MPLPSVESVRGMSREPREREDAAGSGLNRTRGGSADGGANGTRGPHLFRFGLRQFFAFTTAIGVLCAALSAANGPWQAVIVGAAVLIAGHVLGNFLGTRLRDDSQASAEFSAESGLDGPLERAAGRTPRDAAATIPEATSLAGHQGASLRRSQWAAAIGLTLGSCVGGAGALALGGQAVTWAGVAVAAVSCGVLSAWCAMLVAGFLAIGRRAWKEATDRESARRGR